MKKNKQMGFTLIELLAVIVILGVLLAIAIPSVAKYINTAKKSTFVENVQSYASAARNELFLTNSDYQLPVSTGEATVISFKELEFALENGGKKSSYGGGFNDTYSYVIIVNDGTAEKPHFTYYIAALDEKGYGIGEKDTNATADIIQYDSLNENNVVQVGKNNGISVANAASKLGATITNDYPSGFASGTSTTPTTAH